MSLRDVLGRLGGKNHRSSPGGPEKAPEPGSEERRASAAAYLEALESGRLNPPKDIHDVAGWNTYWRNKLQVGMFEQGFADMMASDADLAELLARRGAQTVLCAGNGMSGEALALATLGFDVTALDISSVPAEVMGSIPVDAEHCPAMHRHDKQHVFREGGALKHVVGDLTNPDVCPGPYDVVIERLTLQLFPEHERRVGFDRLVDRLAAKGLLFSQQHMGWWKPGQPRTHFAEHWLASRGLVSNWREESAAEPRLDRLYVTSG